ncbi:MAG: hypothetical protein QOE70_6153 [Chthoniobacter sp.]|jgi:hypothetical protein|nr:hypothetical protein [Chthoniobacter sp.]
MKPSPFRIWFAWSLLAWLLLAGTAFVLQRNLEVGAWAFVAFAPAAVLIAVRQALHAAGGRARALRIGWWIITLIGGGLAALPFQAQWEKLSHDSSQALLVALAAQALGLLLVWRRARWSSSLALRAWLPDAAVALGCVALLGGAGWRAADRYTGQKEERALALWASIGRPMREFEHGLQVVEENSALAALLGDLQPLGIVSLYKATGQSPRRDTLTLPPEVIALLTSTETSAADRVDLAAPGTPFLDAHADQLAQIYQAILEREPAVWAFDPANLPVPPVPNFLATRLCAQLFCADALRRFSLGDSGGANSAVHAGLRMSEKLRDQPILVSIMVQIAVEALFAKAEARLPAETGAWDRLATEAPQMREAFRRAIQCESRAIDRWASGDFDAQLLTDGVLSESTLGFKLPRWAERLAWRPLMRLEAARASLCNAEAIRVVASSETLRTDDLAEARMNGFYEQHPSVMAVNVLRAWARLHGTLLLREQTALIRSARSQLQSGVPGEPTDAPSNVIPGARWKITLDRAAQTVTLKLENAPRWVTGSNAFGPGFYLLPLDGSRGWKLEPTPVPRTAAIQ